MVFKIVYIISKQGLNLRIWLETSKFETLGKLT